MIFEPRKMIGRNTDLNMQKETLEEILSMNNNFEEVLKVSQTEIENYYLGAGNLVQTVWNYLSGNPLEFGINDIDIVYYDKMDLSQEKEAYIEWRINSRLKDLPIKIDVKNEARVHLWYEKKFGKRIEPYASLEEAINSWPTTATALGVRRGDNGEFQVYAPYGLSDLFNMTVRPNKLLVTRAVYEKKAAKWAKLWPNLTVISWDK